MARKSINVLKRFTFEMPAPTTRVCHFVVYGKAAPAGSKTAFVGKSGKPHVRDSSKGSYEWKSKVSDKAAEVFGNKHELVTDPLEVWFTFYVPRPKGHFGTGRNADKLKDSAPTHPSSKPDVLKLARAVEDGMTGVVWRDDAQIVSEHIHKEYGEPARVVIEVNRAT
jgi:Holliday junction resolvase RusA-like endonuclease